MRTIYRVVSTIYNGDTKEVSNRMFKDVRTATRMCHVRNEANIDTSMYRIYVKTTRFYDVYTDYRNFRLYGCYDKISILELTSPPKLIHVSNSLEDAMDYIDNLLK